MALRRLCGVKGTSRQVLSACDGGQRASAACFSSEPGILACDETKCSSGSREGEAIGVIVHGLLGSGRNWRSFSKLLANDLAKASGRPWSFFLIDQRCHGHSHGLPGFDPPSTIQTSAEDLGRFLDTKLQGRKLDSLIGHSLGGKVVMELLLQRRQQSPTAQAWVLDSVVGAARAGKEEPSDVKRVLEEIGKISLPIQSRDWLYDHLESKGFSQGFKLWMGSNLKHTNAGYEWSFDVRCAQQLYDSYQASEFWNLVNSIPDDVQLNLVRAAKSDRWSKRHWGDLQNAAEKSNGAFKLHILPDAGHWLHADNPEGLRKLLASNIV